MSKQERQQRVMRALGEVGVDPETRARYPHEFSGGQRQRIGIARALALNPDVIIADEPISALDVSIQAQILNLLGRLQRDFRLTYLFIAHDLAAIRHISSHVLVMYLGRIVESAPSSELYRRPLHPYTVALLQSIPQLGEPRERLPSIAGEPPDLGRLPAGCPFHPRCDAALDVCRTGEPPPVFTLAQGQQVRCWLREQDHDRSAAGSP